ncbi:hypothetical protein Lal_00037373 [Lupinus albus]|nr:hypothetical protein Lal_00037373 [Lupinus albus]
MHFHGGVIRIPPNHGFPPIMPTIIMLYPMLHVAQNLQLLIESYTISNDTPRESCPLTTNCPKAIEKVMPTRFLSKPLDEDGNLAPTPIQPLIQNGVEDSWIPLHDTLQDPTQSTFPPHTTLTSQEPQPTSHISPGPIPTGSLVPNHSNLEDKVNLVGDGNDRSPPKFSRVTQRPKWLEDYVTK